MGKSRWTSIKARFEAGSAAQKLALYETLEKDHAAVAFEHLLPAGDEVFEALGAAVAKRSALRSYMARDAYLPAVHAALLHQRGELHPPEHDGFLATAFRHEAVSRAHLTPVIEGLPEERRSKVLWWATDAERPESSAPAITKHFGAEAALSGLVARLDDKKPRYYSDFTEARFVEGFTAIGEARWEAGARALEGKLSPRAARLLLRAAREAPLSEPVIVLLMGLLAFGNKGVVADASAHVQGLIAEHDEALRPHLEAGASSRKKAQREACAALLALIDQGGPATPELPEPLARLHAEAERLGEAAKERDDAVGLYAKRATCEAISGSGYSDWARALEPLRDSDEAAWVAVLALAELPSGGDKFRLSQLRKRTKRTFGARLVPGLRWALTAREPAQAALLYELLAGVEGSEHVEAAPWLPALSSSRKKERDAAVQQLAYVSEDLSAQLLPLLGARRKDTRLAAATLLAQCPLARCPPAQRPPAEVDLLQAALDAEEELEVAQLLRQAIAASAPEETSADAPEAAAPPSPSALLERLAAVRKKRAPKWLDPSALPPLTLALGEAASGEALPEASRDGLLAWLSLEGPDHHDPELLALRELFDPAAASAFSVAILDAWQAAGTKARFATRRDATTGPSKDKWAVFQQAFFVDDERIAHMGNFLRSGFASSNHHQVDWVLTTLSRHPSPAAMEPILERAVFAPQRTALTRARELLAERAQRDGSTPMAMLRASSVCAPKLRLSPRAPSFGLTPRGLRLDYGPRCFWLRVAPGGELTLHDDDDSPRASLPKAGKGDDPAKVAAAKERYKDQKAALKEYLTVASRDLEGEMASRVYWSAAQVEGALLNNPVLGQLAQGLVFLSSEGALVRPAGERLVTVDGAPYPLRPELTLSLPHLLELTNAQLDDWQDHLHEAGVTPPFPQLNRPYHLKGRSSFAPASDIPFMQFQRARERVGWSPIDDGYGGSERSVMTFGARGVKAVLHHSSVGPYLRDPVRLYSLTFTDLLDAPLPEDQIDPVAWSEALLAAELVS